MCSGRGVLCGQRCILYCMCDILCASGVVFCAEAVASCMEVVVLWQPLHFVWKASGKHGILQGATSPGPMALLGFGAASSTPVHKGACIERLVSVFLHVESPTYAL